MWTNFDSLAAPDAAPEHAFSLHHDKLLRIRLGGDQAWSKHGAMVAYQGQVEFDYSGSGSLGKFVKKQLTGEGQRLMTFSGQGDVYVADNGRDIFTVYLQNESVTVNGTSLLAFSQGIEWDIKRVKGIGGMAGAGLFNTVLSGTGWVALTSRGKPIMFDVARAPTTVDPNAAIAWSTTVTTDLKTAFKVGNLIGRGSGESVQMACSGQGWVLVQPAEEMGFAGAA